MSAHEMPRVAVVGLGEAGRGWAALAAAAGWSVAVYDQDSLLLQNGADDIAARVRRLMELDDVDRALAESALAALRVGRSLLHTVADADWIIEAGPEDLHARQRALEHIEQVARLAAVTTSSTRRYHASALCARLRRPERFLVIHALEPAELQPIVELVPGPRTDPACVDDLRFWLAQLRRDPLVLRREIPGHAIGRITAAVWRECIQLVLDGVLDVEEVDRLVAQGPAAAWAAGGPHLTQFLAAGDQPAVGLPELLVEHEEWWGALAAWHQLDPDAQGRLVRLVGKAYAEDREERRAARDERLPRVLTAAREREQ